MGIAERRERQRQEVRQKILDAARALFTEFGYEAVSMRGIAEKIEYSPTAIYLHFADKEALVRVLCSLDFQELGVRFRELAEERDPVRRLRGIGAAFLRFAQQRPNQYRMMFMTPHPPVPVDQRAIEKDNPEVDAWAFMKGTVAEAQAAGLLGTDLGGPDVVAQLLFSAVHGVASLHISKANDPWIDWRPVDEMGDRMIEVLLRGCGHKSAIRRPNAKKPRKHRS